MTYLGPIRSGQRTSGVIAGGTSTTNVTIAAVQDITKCLVTVERSSGGDAALPLKPGARITTTTNVEISNGEGGPAASDATVYFHVLEFK